MASKPSVALRLGMEGAADIEAGLQKLGDSGSATGKRIANDFEGTGAAIEALQAKMAQAFDPADIKRISTEIDALTAKATTSGQKLAAIGGGYVLGNTDQNAQVQTFLKFQQDQTRQAEALRNAIDPLRVAQAAYDNELRVANSLLAQGKISQAEYQKAVALSNDALQQAKSRLNDVDGAHGKVSTSGAIMQHVVRSTADSFAAGLPAAMIFGEQLSRVAEAASFAGAGEGALGKVVGLLSGPWGIAVTAGVSVLSVFIPKLLETDDKAQKAADQGLKAFENRQKEMAGYIDTTTGKIRMQNAELARLLSLQFPAAIQSKVGETQGYVNSAFYAARQKLSQEGSSRAGPRDSDLSQAIANAGSNSTALAKNIDDLVAKGRTDLAALANIVGDYAAKALEANAATHQMVGSQDEWNARAQGATVLTTDLVQTLVDRAVATDKVSAAQQRLSELQDKKASLDAMPYSPAQQSALRQWQADLTAARKEVENLQAAEKAAGKEATAAQKAAAEFAKTIASTSGGIARLAEENDKRIGGQLTTEFNTGQKGRDDQEKKQADSFGYSIEQLANQKDALAQSQVELATIGMSADKRQVILDLYAKQLELQRNNVDLNSQEAKDILAGVAAQDAMTQSIQRSSAAMEEVRSFTSGLIDDLAQGKLKASDLLQEFIKLAAINPLKNLLGGAHQTTLGDVLGGISKLLGGGSSGAISVAGSGWGTDLSTVNTSLLDSLPKFATGTDYAPGGMAWVAENGPELINLPKGSSVKTASQTRQILGQGNHPVVVQLQVGAGELFDARVSSISDGRVAVAAPAIAAGGGRMGQKLIAQRQRYSLAGR